ncbi:MAG: LysR family transcriptional regulator [Advenella sp.]|uniref:LysR family transcriptional regulator n=1 Tax=Advenella sp. TaxID=1872388 RepID=UPI003F955D64
MTFGVVYGDEYFNTVNAMNFDLKDLRAFVAVAKLGSFGLAAEELHISQPALSRRIEKLETALGVRLLHRTTRKVVLTAVGREFFQKATDVLNSLEGSLLGIRDVAGHVSGEVIIACIPSAIRYFLPNILNRYHTNFPRIVIKVIDQGANDVLATVIRSEADFGLNYIGTQDPQLEFEPVLNEKFVLACKKGHPLSSKRKVKWSDLTEFDYISVTRASGNRLLMDMALSQTTNRPRWFCEAQHVSTLVNLVEAGVGIAAVPSLAMPVGDHPTLVSIPLVEPSISRTVGLIRRVDRTLPPAAKQLYDYVKDFRSSAKE